MHPKYLFKCVCSKEFEDLDEIVARYVQPMASFARDLLNHKYYQDCNGGDKKVRQCQDVVTSWKDIHGLCVLLKMWAPLKHLSSFSL